MQCHWHPWDSRSCSWQWLQQLCARPCSTSSYRDLLETPASHILLWVTRNVFCRWRHGSHWHHMLQNQNLSTSLQGRCRFPLGMEKCKKKAHECHQGLGANKEWFITPSWAALSSLHGSVVSQQDTGWKAENKHSIKTNHSTAPASPFKEELTEPPVCEPVLVIFLMASLQSARKRPCQENSSTHTLASLQWTRAKWNIWWEGFKTCAVKEGNGQKSSQLSALSILKSIRPG